MESNRAEQNGKPVSKAKAQALAKYERILSDSRYSKTRVNILKRMDAVARLRARGMTVTEIQERLAEESSGIKDPDGKPWGWRVIWQDCDVISELWKKRHQETVDEIVPALLAELREVRRAAWSAGDLNAVLASIRQERAMLGLDEPKKIEIGLNMRARIEQLARLYGFSVDEIQAELTGVLHELNAN